MEAKEKVAVRAEDSQVGVPDQEHASLSKVDKVPQPVDMMKSSFLCETNLFPSSMEKSLSTSDSSFSKWLKVRKQPPGARVEASEGTC